MGMKAVVLGRGVLDGCLWVCEYMMTIIVVINICAWPYDDDHRCDKRLCMAMQALQHTTYTTNKNPTYTTNTNRGVSRAPSM